MLCKRNQVIAFVLSAMCLFEAVAQQSEKSTQKQERIALLTTSVDKILQQLHAKQGPGMAVWVEFEGQVVFNNWGGLAHRDNKIPIDGNTTFELASASKPLTATLTLNLAEDGLLNLDDPVAKWLPDIPPDWSRITVQNLLTQTSGIPDYMNQINGEKLLGLDGLTNHQLMQRWSKNNQLNFAPGSELEYSNSNYVLLAEIIAKVCGTSFGNCLRQRVLQPLGMTQTRVESDDSVDGEILALNYAKSKKTKGIQLRTEGPTGIYSSLRDIAIWLRAYQDGKIISKSGTEQMVTPVSLNAIFENGERYGMGWVLPADNRPVGAYTHAGQKDGYRTLISANPFQHMNYIILTNGGDFLQPAVTEVQYWIQTLIEHQP